MANSGETRSITIWIKNPANSGDASVDVSNAVNGNNAKENDNNKLAKAAFDNMVRQVTDTVVSEVLDWAGYGIDLYLNMTDDYIGQRNMNVAVHYINGAKNLANSIWQGAVMGSAIPGIGTAIGAAIGATLSMIGAVKSNLRGSINQNIQLKQTELQLDYTRKRAGWSTNAASIGEDL